MDEEKINPGRPSDNRFGDNDRKSLANIFVSRIIDLNKTTCFFF